MKSKYFFGLLFVIFFFSSFLYSIGFLSSVNLQLTDNLYGGKTALDAIVIISVDEESIDELGRWPWDRKIIAETINKLHDAKVVGLDIGFFDSTESDSFLKDSVEDSENIVLAVQYISFVDGKGENLLTPVIDNALDYGYINVITDSDGVTRSVDMTISDDFESFSNVMVKNSFGSQKKNNHFLINFVGGPNSFTYVPFSDLYFNRNNFDFTDKIVLIGSVAHSLHDNYVVPTGREMPGVEVHANTIQTLINRDFLSYQSFLSIIITILISVLIISFFTYYFDLIYSVIFSIAYSLIYLFLAIIMFDKGIILNVVHIPLTAFLSFLSIVSFKYIFEKKSKKEIVSAFNKYVSPAVLKDILKAPDKLKLGGSRRKITVFFSDIRGFTTISEKLKPEELVTVLNEYLSSMTKIVMDHEGVVDKYIGDAIMAFWGAPLDQPDHAVLGCSTSLDMIEELHKLQKDWKKRNMPELKIGIGLNTGDAIIGNMGSFDRFDYTAIGDSINLGARLEGQTKQYGVDIIISETTNNAVKDKFITRKLDLVTVKGKNKPIAIYELVCRNHEKYDKEIIENYEQGFKYYLEKKWDKAIDLFSKVDDFASKNMIERCNSFKKNPPDLNWDGVWKITKK